MRVSQGQDARLSEDHDRLSVLSQGRRLVRERRVWNGEDWVKGLSITFELVDRQDWRTLLCVTGRLAVSRLAGLNSVTLRFFGDDHVAPVFCVDELGRGGQYQWQGMLDVFSAPDLWGQHVRGSAHMPERSPTSSRSMLTSTQSPVSLVLRAGGRAVDARHAGLGSGRAHRPHGTAVGAGEGAGQPLHARDRRADRGGLVRG